MSVFCVKCGTENKQEYNFCKNCGAKLPDLEENYTPPVETVAEEPEICGIKKRHLQSFVGENSDKILSRFDGMELADSRVSWCWPAAVLGFFFGFFGISFWFFYRKMYKPAFVSVFVGTVFYLAQSFFTYTYLAGALSEILEIFSTSLIQAGNFQLFLQSLENALSSSAVGVNFANILSDAGTSLAAIFGGLFGLNVYKNHVVKKVTDALEEYGGDEILDKQLKKSGGVNGGMAFLGVMIMVVITSAISTVMIISLLL